MKKVLTILLVICYSCTSFSQNSMNDITKLRIKIDSIDNLISHLDPINYPVPVFEDKLSQLEKRHESAIQEYYAMNNFKPSIYKTDRNIAIKAFSITALCLGPITGAALLSNDYYTDKNEYAIAGSCFIGVPVAAVSAILISNNRYRKSQEDWRSYRARLDSKSAEINLLEDRIEEEKENIKVLRAEKYRTRKSNLQEERVCLINELNEVLIENGCVVFDTITKFENSYFDYNSEYLFKNDLISKKSFSIILDTLGYRTTPLNHYDKSPTRTITLNIAKNIKLKKGRYFYTTTDTARIGDKNKFGNYRYKDIPIRFEYNINYNGNEYEITKRTYKNNKLIGTSYFNNVAEAEEDEKEEVESIKKELFIYYREY